MMFLRSLGLGLLFVQQIAPAKPVPDSHWCYGDQNCLPNEVKPAENEFRFIFEDGYLPADLASGTLSFRDQPGGGQIIRAGKNWHCVPMEEVHFETSLDSGTVAIVCQHKPAPKVVHK